MGIPQKQLPQKSGFEKVVWMQVFHKAYPIWGLNTFHI